MFDFFDFGEIKEEETYEDKIQNRLDNDEISPSEAGFMLGYG